MDNILKYLENTAEKFPDKTAVDDGNQQFTYQELLNRARHFGLSFLNRTEPGRPVAILHEKAPRFYPLCLALFMQDVFM